MKSRETKIHFRHNFVCLFVSLYMCISTSVINFLSLFSLFFIDFFWSSCWWSAIMMIRIFIFVLFTNLFCCFWWPSILSPKKIRMHLVFGYKVREIHFVVNQIRFHQKNKSSWSFEWLLLFESDTHTKHRHNSLINKFSQIWFDQTKTKQTW